MSSWCPTWVLDEVCVGRRELWWVVGDLGRMGILPKSFVGSLSVSWGRIGT